MRLGTIKYDRCMDNNAEARIADIRKRNEERKAAEQHGLIGGARADFDVDFLLRYIEQLLPSSQREVT